MPASWRWAHVVTCFSAPRYGSAKSLRQRPARLGIEGDGWPSEDYFMWAVGLRSHDRVDDRGLAMTAMHALACRAVDGFHEDWQALVRAADPNDLVVVPIRTTPPLRRSVPGRVTLIGDAVHTM